MTTSRQEQARAREAAFKLYRNATDPVEKLRVYAISRGVNGIESLNKIFRDMDIRGRTDRHIDKEEFIRGLSAFGFEASKREMAQVFDAIDTQRNGYIDYVDLMEDMSPNVSHHRQALIKEAFDSVDTSGNGVIALKELEKAVDLSHNEDVRSGQQTEAEVMRRFLRQIGGSDSGGAVTWKEFNDFYSGVSVSIDRDSDFESLMYKAYRLDGGGGQQSRGSNRQRIDTRFPRLENNNRGRGRQNSENFFSNWERYHDMDDGDRRNDRSQSAGYNNRHTSGYSQRGGRRGDGDWLEQKWLREIQEETGEVPRHVRKSRSYDRFSDEEEDGRYGRNNGRRGRKQPRQGYYKKFTESKINWLNKWNKNLNSDDFGSKRRKSVSHHHEKSNRNSRSTDGDRKKRKGYWFSDWEDVHGIDLTDNRLDKNGNSRGYERSRSAGGRGGKIDLEEWENFHDRMGARSNSFSGNRRQSRRRARSEDDHRDNDRSSREVRKFKYYSYK